jgi:hypothetical protein
MMHRYLSFFKNPLKSPISKLIGPKINLVRYFASSGARTDFWEDSKVEVINKLNSLVGSKGETLKSKGILRDVPSQPHHSHPSNFLQKNIPPSNPYTKGFLLPKQTWR